MNKVTKPISSGPPQSWNALSKLIFKSMRGNTAGGAVYKLHTNGLFYLVQIKHQCCSQHVPVQLYLTVPCEYEASACADLS